MPAGRSCCHERRPHGTPSRCIPYRRQVASPDATAAAHAELRCSSPGGPSATRSHGRDARGRCAGPCARQGWSVGRGPAASRQRAGRHLARRACPIASRPFTKHMVVSYLLATGAVDSNTPGRHPTGSPTTAPVSPGGNSPPATGPAPGLRRSAAPSPRRRPVGSPTYVSRTRPASHPSPPSGRGHLGIERPLPPALGGFLASDFDANAPSASPAAPQRSRSRAICVFAWFDVLGHARRAVRISPGGDAPVPL
jgi:hypothetical protein